MELAHQISCFLLRSVTGWMFFQHGAQKWLGWYGGMPPDQPPITLLSVVGVGGLLELVGGLLIVLGLFTRPVAFLLSGEMAVAYWGFHAKALTWPVENGGELAVLYCFIFLFMAAQGGGTWSLDAMKRKGRAGGY
jgi:putative oxidoreductase